MLKDIIAYHHEQFQNAIKETAEFSGISIEDDQIIINGLGKLDEFVEYLQAEIYKKEVNND